MYLNPCLQMQQSHHWGREEQLPLDLHGWGSKHFYSCDRPTVWHCGQKTRIEKCLEKRGKHSQIEHNPSRNKMCYEPYIWGIRWPNCRAKIVQKFHFWAQSSPLDECFLEIKTISIQNLENSFSETSWKIPVLLITCTCLVSVLWGSNHWSRKTALSTKNSSPLQKFGHLKICIWSVSWPLTLSY